MTQGTHANCVTVFSRFKFIRNVWDCQQFSRIAKFSKVILTESLCVVVTIRFGREFQRFECFCHKRLPEKTQVYSGNPCPPSPDLRPAGFDSVKTMKVIFKIIWEHLAKFVSLSNMQCGVFLNYTFGSVFALLLRLLKIVDPRVGCAT